MNTPAGSTRDRGVKKAGDAVQQTGDAVNGAVQQTGNAVNGAVGGVTGVADGATQGTGPVGEAVDGATDTVDERRGQVTVEGLNQTTNTVTGTLNGVTGSGG